MTENRQPVEMSVLGPDDLKQIRGGLAVLEVGETARKKLVKKDNQRKKAVKKKATRKKDVRKKATRK